MNFMDVMGGVAVHVRDDMPQIKAVDNMSEAVQRAAEEIIIAGTIVANLRGDLVAATCNKSISRHSIKEEIRSQHKLIGEKITEGAIDDKAVSDPRYTEACLAEVTAVKDLGKAEVELDSLTSVRDLFIATLGK